MKNTVEQIRKEMARALVGQRGLVDGLLTALLCNQHVLVEGVPGLAKTTAVRAFSRVLGLSFRRIQFTPDLLPADLLGTHVYEPQRGEFRLHRGPIFHHLILASAIVWCSFSSTALIVSCLCLNPGTSELGNA